MKRRRYFTVLAVMFWSVMMLFTACNGTAEKKETAGETGLEETPTVLTHVFRGEEVVLPDGLTRYNSVDVMCTEDRLKLCCYEMVTEGEETVRKNYIYEAGITGAGIDGSDPVFTEIMPEMENIRISYGVFTEESFVFVGAAENEAGVTNYALYVCCPADGSYTVFDNVRELRPVDGKLYLTDLEADEEGYIYLSAETSYGVLRPDGTRLFERNVSYAAGLSRDAEGKVCLTGYLDGASGMDIMRINRETKSLEAVCVLPAGIQAENYYVGPGYDVYYARTDGLYGYTSGMETGELILNWENSDLSMDSVIRLQVLSPEKMILLYNDLTPGNYRTVSAVFTKAADIDLTQLVTVQLACVVQELYFSNAVSIFNKNNPGIRVVVRDYSVYNTEENETGGETRLMNDILNGLYKPDIVAGGSEGRVIPTLIEKGMFVDLYSFMDEDDPVQKDDLIGCIKNTFEVDGHLSAISRSFAVTTLLAKRETVGDKTTWTLSEMLDLAFSLGEDQYMMSWLDQDYAVRKLLGANSYNQFIDMENNTCDFDSPVFIRLLEYIELLGEKGEYGVPFSPYEGTQTGKVMLYRWYCDRIDEPQFEQVPFRTEDVVRIGYPTSGGEGTGTEVNFNETCQAYLIPSVSEHPEAAWEFLSYYVGTPDQIGVFGFRSLKSLICREAEQEEKEGSLQFIGFDGMNISWSGIEKEITYMEDGTVCVEGSPGILTTFNRERFDEFLAWLDTVGTPMGAVIPEEVTNIINEEISSFIGGAKSAEDTAKIIQSRVSLWLAEHE